MAAYNSEKPDLDLHRRKIFVQNLSPDTTERSLKDYFSKYPMQRCVVPLDKMGKNRMHGIVVFQKEDSVDAVMSIRHHKIDDKVVFIHRSIPIDQSCKDNIGIQQLIVSGLKNQSLTESNIRRYFTPYGEIHAINTMKNDDNIWVIDFDYYDSVDKIILNAPHRIGQIDVNVKKGDRNAPRTSIPKPTTNKNDASEIMPKKSILKHVKINEQTSCLNLPPKKYRIHIMNLPANIDAEALSDELFWNIYDIVMDPSINECWLKNANDKRQVNEFIECWNRKAIRRSIITCEIEEDQLELCNRFQFGRCKKTSADCDWEHILCTAKGSCASTCPYGHEFGMKSEHDSPPVPPITNISYRIKITGSKTRITQNKLQLRSRLVTYSIDPEDERVIYVSKIKTMKYAKQLMNEWHNKVIDGQQIKCQLELNPRPPRAPSPTASASGKRIKYRSRSRSQDARSIQSAQEISDFDDTDNLNAISFDNIEVDRDRRLWGKALNDITQTPPAKYRLPSGVSTDEWEVTNKASNSDGKLLLIRNKVDRKGLAAIKIYPIQSSDDCNREISAMKDLIGVKGVSKLIEHNANCNQIWMIMERAPGYTLKEFIERKCECVLEMTKAVELTLNLIGIIQQMHIKGVFHQNLSPENILIEWNSKFSTDSAQLTVLNFSQGVISSNKTSTSIPSKEKWYHVPQINDQGLRSTIDPSSCCRILFWLLTRIDPRCDNDKFPHEQARNELNDMIKSTVKNTSKDRQMLVEEQLRRYMIDMFNRAFGYPYYHPWTINDLKCRLELILRLLIPSEPKLNTIDGIFQELISTSDLKPIPSVAIYDIQRDAFEKASKTFCQAKKYFLENGKNQYRWSHGLCTWIYHPHTSINERCNDDILIYRSFHGETIVSYSVIITCLARSSEEGRVMTLFISSNFNGKTIEIPIGQYPTAQDYSQIAEESFRTELTNLLLAIYNEQKPVKT